MNESFAIHGYSMQNQFMCVIQGDDILQMDYMTGTQKVIGKTMAAYTDLEQTTTEYYNKLVELGVIEKPKDPQETMKEMQETMKQMAGLIQSLSQEVKELKEHGSEHDFSSNKQDVPERKSQRSSTKGAGDDSGNTR